MGETSNASLDCNGEDRISKLQDELIHNILSFIDTKYAVQTSVLSKRWIDIWKSLRFLNFNRSSFSLEKTERFIDFVYMVFMFRDDINIQMLNMRWDDSDYGDTVVMNVNRWILNAVKHNVKEITIIITHEFYDSTYEIPHRLLNNKSLRKLKMIVFGKAKYTDATLPGSISLPQLKELIIYGFSISNIERLCSGCPVLEKLEITDCNILTDNHRNLIVDSISLKEFGYTFWDRRPIFFSPQKDAMASIFKLCAPNLETFGCRSLLTRESYLENSSLLSRACFDMFLEEKEDDENAETYSKLPLEEKDVYANRMMQFLGAVHTVKELSLSSGFLESSLADVGSDWEAGLMSSPGMLCHLKYIEIEEVLGCDAELKILSFLLKNAKVLEEVVIFFRSSVSSPNRVRQVEQFKDKLRKVPTASSSIQLVFNEA